MIEVHTRVECPVCRASSLQYEFRVDSGRIIRCTECTLLFVDDSSSSAVSDESLLYRQRAVDGVAHLYHGTAAPQTILAIVPRSTADIPGADVVAADDFVARGAARATYDAVLCIDALDRVADPDALLTRLRDVLAPGATAAFTVPSVSSSAARYAGTSWRGFRSGALRFFSVDTLQSLLVRYGFRDAKFYTDGAIRPGSLRIRTAAGVLGLVGLRGAGVRALRPANLLDESMTAVAVRGDLITRPRLSVIIPVYNERSTFRELMARLVAKEIDGVDIEIIIVESNSPDGSRDEVLAYASHPRITILLQDRPGGKGNAVRAGLKRATGDVVLFQDADLEYEIDDYDALLGPINAYRRNFVIGSRHAKKGSAWKMREFTGAPVLSQIFNGGHLVFLGLLNSIYGQSLEDPFSMFKVFRRDCIAGLVLECNRFDFDFEIVIKLLRKGYRALEIPVNYQSRSVAEGKKVTMVRDPLTWLAALVKFRTSDLYPNDRRR